VTAITYTDETGVTATLAPSTYVVDPDSEPGRIVLARGKSWPAVTLATAGAIKVTFKAGYGDTAASVPQRIKQTLLLLIGHWYENREPVVVGNYSTQLPFTLEVLLAQDRVY
jgi:uncharacterized phiE125 gp8 family phage protein